MPNNLLVGREHIKRQCKSVVQSNLRRGRIANAQPPLHGPCSVRWDGAYLKSAASRRRIKTLNISIAARLKV